MAGIHRCRNVKIWSSQDPSDPKISRSVDLGITGSGNLGSKDLATHEDGGSEMVNLSMINVLHKFSIFKNE